MKIPENNLAREILRQFCVAYKERSMEKAMNLFTKDCILFGTGKDEYWEGSAIKTQFERDWCQSEHGEIVINKFCPNTPNDLWTAAICTAILVVENKTYSFENLRGTIIIQQENKIWKIAHMHASFPDLRNPENGSFPISE